jgi:hypothetical protein
LSIAFTPSARRLGIASAGGVAALLLAYATTLAVGLASLASPNEPIADPMFSILEVLILLLAPAMVALMAAVHAWAPASRRALTLTAFACMTVAAGITCSVHFAILAVSRDPAFAQQPWAPLVFSFRWPSLAYALDILAWDFFFALAMLFAAPAFRGTRLAAVIRGTMTASGLLALAGLWGVAARDMQLRNVGIVGYVGVFLVVAVLLAVLFRRTPAAHREE